MISVRDQVLEHIAETIHAAEAEGQNGIDAARQAYPGTPDSVLGEAAWLAEERRSEAWWSAVEKTVDGEIIKAALIEQGGPR